VLVKMNIFKHIAIVGRPNVGKSRLFNRLVGKRMSIVHDEPGVTRDIISAVVDNHFTLMDTGGLGMAPDMTNQAIHNATEEQVDFAILAAQLVLFVVDGQKGLLPHDEEIASMLHRHGKQVMLVVNKMDHPENTTQLNDFYRLGFKQVFGVSAEHGHGSSALQKAIQDFVGPKSEATEDETEPENRRLSICFAGRPNVGKSSLSNCLLKENRMIVSAVPGTTRDAVQKDFDFTTPSGKIWPFSLIDTAGMRYKQKMDSSVEFYSTLRSTQSMQGADVVFLVVDAKEGVTKQDKRIAGEVLEAGRPMALIVNKWDHAQEAFQKGEVEGYDNIRDFRDKFAEFALKELFFLSNTPVIFTSAIQNYSMDRILKAARMLFEIQCTTIPTSKVNKTVRELLERTPPTIVGNRRFKVYYALQSGTNPITIKVFCNQAHRLEDSYKRYLLTNFNNTFGLKGCPVFFDFVSKLPREQQDALKARKGKSKPKKAGIEVESSDD